MLGAHVALYATCSTSRGCTRVPLISTKPDMLLYKLKLMFKLGGTTGSGSELGAHVLVGPRFPKKTSCFPFRPRYHNP
jgi:hypothetical protein